MEFSIRLERITKIFLREKLSAWIKQSSLYRCNNILWRTRQESGANVLSLSTAKIARFLRILSNTIAWRSLINRVESRHASKDSTRKQREREEERKRRVVFHPLGFSHCLNSKEIRSHLRKAARAFRMMFEQKYPGWQAFIGDSPVIINWNEELFILLSDATKEKIVEQSFYFKFDDLSILRKRKEIFFSLSSFSRVFFRKKLLLISKSRFYFTREDR